MTGQKNLQYSKRTYRIKDFILTLFENTIEKK